MQAAAWAVLEIPSMHTAARWRPSVRLRLRAPGSEPGHSSPICYTLNSGTVKPLLERQRSPDLERLIWIGANLRNTRLRWGNFHHSAEAQSHWLLWEVGSETWWTPWKCSPKQSTRENVRRFSHGHTRLPDTVRRKWGWKRGWCLASSWHIQLHQHPSCQTPVPEEKCRKSSLLWELSFGRSASTRSSRHLLAHRLPLRAKCPAAKTRRWLSLMPSVQWWTNTMAQPWL